MTERITSGQEKQFRRFVEDAADKALAEVNLDKDGLQRLIENGGEFQSCIVVAVRKLSRSNQFASEEVKSDLVYPSGYKPKSIAEQTKILRRLFRGVGYADEDLVFRTLPVGAEAWFAIPRWQKVAETYNEAVGKVLKLIKQQHKGKFYAWCEGRLGPQYLRQHEGTAKKLRVVGNQQKGYDILVVAAQFGLRHRGRSVLRAREVMEASEFGLGAFEIGCMLLMHPERLANNSLYILCAGNEYDPGGEGCDFLSTPFFGFSDGEIGFGTDWAGVPDARYGSASGFLFSQ